MIQKIFHLVQTLSCTLMILQIIFALQQRWTGAVVRNLRYGWNKAHEEVGILSDDVDEPSTNLIDALNIQESHNRHPSAILKNLMNFTDVIDATIE
jgi:hypothetical protein